MTKSPFRYFKTSPEIIQLAVMMYVRFPLSLRNVEDLLHERGIDICHETVRHWVDRFGTYFAHGSEVEHTVSAFIEQFGDQDPDVLANTVFGNRQRTSSRSGILKADAVMRFARVLKSHGIQKLADMEDVGRHEAVRRDLSRIPGQGSGLTFDYCLMLAGSDAFVKADRMICRYIGNAIELDGPASVELARALLLLAVENLRCRYSSITPRAVDFAIWEIERGSS